MLVAPQPVRVCVYIFKYISSLGPHYNLIVFFLNKTTQYARAHRNKYERADGGQGKGGVRSQSCSFQF